jgi:predicted RecA/RadA family phage recombinase
MALNQEFVPGNRLSLPCTQPATPASGDPVLVGQMPGVALTDEGDGGNVATNTSIQTDGVWNFLVEAVVAAGNSAVAVGDILYYDSAATIKINKDVTNGVRFGYALDTVTSGSSGTIRVKIGY